MESRRPETEDFRTLLPLFQLYERWHVIEHSTFNGNGNGNVMKEEEQGRAI